MVASAIIDLYVPAHIGELDAICERAAAAGLDGIVVVFDSGDDLPGDGELHELQERFGVAVHVGRSIVSAQGFRVVVLGVEHIPAEMIAAIEATGDPTLIRAALAELKRDLAGPRAGFAVLRVGLRQLPGGVAETHPVPLQPEDANGLLAILTSGSVLARDLDCEALGEAGIPMLAASGPFATLADIGRFATALPVHPGDHGAVARALGSARSFAVEMWTPPKPPARGAKPDPFEGPADDAREDARRGRRPRRRGPRKTTAEAS